MRTLEDHDGAFAETVMRGAETAGTMKEIPNMEIRRALFNTRIKQYELAKLLGVSDVQVSRLLKEELPAKKRDKILRTIREEARRRAKAVFEEGADQK